MRKLSHRLNDFLRCLTAVLTASSPRQSNFGVHPAIPMNDDNHLTCIVIDINNDLLNQSPNDALLQTHVNIRAFPYRLQLVSQLLQLLSRRRHHRALIVHPLRDLTLNSMDTLQRLVPAPLQFGGDQTVLRVHRIVLSLRPARTIPSRFQVPLQGRQNLIPFAGDFLACHHSRLHCRWLHNTQHLSRNLCNNWYSTKPDAARLAIVQCSSLAEVAQRIGTCPRIADAQLMATAATTQ